MFKSGPQWMREFRLTALEHLLARPQATGGSPMLRVPHIANSDRLVADNLGDRITSLTARFGFQGDTDVPAALCFQRSVKHAGR